MQMNDLDAKYGVSQQAASAVQVSRTDCALDVNYGSMQHSENTCASRYIAGFDSRSKVA